MKPVGIVSIPLDQPMSPQRRFTALMGAAGHNTGNLLFTNAVWQQIAGPKERVGFNFDPLVINRKFRALVFPAANWFGSHVDFGWLADLIEQLEIPVVLIGLGTQDSDFSGKVAVPEGTVRFVKAVSERSHSISVRGDYTRQILQQFGINNVTVTGCPSLFHLLQADADARLRRSSAIGPLLLHSTRYSARYAAFTETPSLHLDLFRLAYHSQTDLLLQSEPEEISYLMDVIEKPEVDDALKAQMVRLYQAQDWPQLEAFIHGHAKVFFDIPSWNSAMSGYARVFGTRLHATIMALNSGVPAILAHHDSRTREMCEFAGIPSVSANDAIASLDWIDAAFAQADFEHFIEQRNRNKAGYEQFLLDNALLPPVTAKTQI